MKKNVFVILSLILAAALCACAQTPPYRPDPSVKPSETPSETLSGSTESPAQTQETTDITPPGTTTEAPEETPTTDQNTQSESRTESPTKTSPTESPTSGQEDYGMIAVYLGVCSYGEEAADKDHKNDLRFRFFVDGEEKTFAIDSGETADGTYTYKLQNLLREGALFGLTEENGVITDLAKLDDLPAGEVFRTEDGRLRIGERTLDDAVTVYAVQKAAGGATVLPTRVPDGARAVYAYGNCLPALYLLPEESENVKAPVSGTPGLRTVRNFLQTALMPVGSTLYMYGGGWDWQDEGSSAETCSIGVSPEWRRFFDEQDAEYTYKNADDPAHSYYPHGGVNYYHYWGLDCSGYLGWTLYNTLENESGRPGYVSSSTSMAMKLADAGLGVYEKDLIALKTGSVVSIRGHVWLCIGVCEDGSAVILHSSPTDSKTGAPGGGVQIAAVGNDGCQAYALAQKYMTEYYPAWAARYNVLQADPARYFFFEEDNKSGVFNFSTDEKGLLDPDGYLDMSPEQVLKDLFGE